MLPPGRSCDLGANQEVGIFHGRMEQGIRAGIFHGRMGIRAGTLLRAAAAAARLHRRTREGETEGQQGEKILSLFTPILFPPPQFLA